MSAYEADAVSMPAGHDDLLQPTPRPTATIPTPGGIEVIDSLTLMAGQRRRTILHNGEHYCLQLTRAGKLLLTK